MNAADPKAVADGRKEERRLRAFELADLEEVLRSKAGRRFYYRLVFEMCSIQGACFDHQIKDGLCASLHMVHREGVRHVARTLELEAQTHAPDLYLLMLKERLERDAEEAKRKALEQEPKGESP